MYVCQLVSIYIQHCSNTGVGKIFECFWLLMSSSVSHDPSEITLICWFGAQYTFLIITDENSFAA